MTKTVTIQFPTDMDLTGSEAMLERIRGLYLFDDEWSIVMPQLNATYEIGIRVPVLRATEVMGDIIRAGFLD